MDGTENNTLSRIKTKLSSWFTKKNLVILCVLLLCVASVWSYLNMVPKNFPIGEAITVEPGESLQSITTMLHEKGIISHPFVFRTIVILLGGEKKVKAGDYLLDSREGAATLASRLVHGQYHLFVVKITIPEGWNVYQMADYLSKNLISFNRTEFLKLTKGKEGYLFPDTYFVSPAIKLEALVKRMEANFEDKLKDIPGIATTTRKLSDIITMASILEEEARTTESRRMVSGILWKRLSLKMPLQVDSTFLYINGKNTYELTLDDLQIDSPYNTYRYGGLPPTPIANPGADAIFAALNPTPSKYIYFLSSKSGNMYYATTFEQHKRNKELYLNK